jgi:putative hemolysin
MPRMRSFRSAKAIAGISQHKFISKFVPFAKSYGIHGRWLHSFGMPRLQDYSANHNDTLGRIGQLEVRLARNAYEIKTCQKLRYKVFYEELSAFADTQTRKQKRDADAFDPICDHLVVLDHAPEPQARTISFRKSTPRIVGTYRLLRQSIAERHGGFYTAQEYDIGPMLARHEGRKFLELGRSCVLPAYRTKRTVELLWQGIWAYVLQHNIDVMFGCASLEGTDPDKLALPLSFLHHKAGAETDWQVKALASRYTSMNRMHAADVQDKAALHSLPPLIKGYLRLGAMIGDGAVIDRQFNTTDVFIILPRERLNPRYIHYYGADGERRLNS